MINHSFAPRFKYPDILFDCQKAVRFIRYNAKRYGIHSDLGAMGHSSGGYLSSMLGVLDTIIKHPKNGMDSVSSKVQAVVTLATPFNLSDFGNKGDTAIRTNVMLSLVLDYMGELPRIEDGNFVLSGKYAEASPVTHISNDDAPFLIYYSDDDPLIPIRHAKAFYKKLMDNNVYTNMSSCHNCTHNPIPDMNQVDLWFKKYLR
jgi:acetyl esterase/lipase